MFLVVIVFLFLGCNKIDPGTGRSKDDVSNQKVFFDTVEVVSKIREKVESINSAKDLNSSKLDMFEYSSEGGELIVLSKNDSVKKLIATYYGSIGKVIEEYYIDKNNLIFVFTVEITYDKPITQYPVSIVSKAENRYYFWEGKLIRWLDENKNQVNPDSEIFKVREEEVLNMDFYTKSLDE